MAKNKGVDFGSTQLPGTARPRPDLMEDAKRALPKTTKGFSRADEKHTGFDKPKVSDKASPSKYTKPDTKLPAGAADAAKKKEVNRFDDPKVTKGIDMRNLPTWKTTAKNSAVGAHSNFTGGKKPTAKVLMGKSEAPRRKGTGAVDSPFGGID